ncbi:MAG TPA: D-alanyl-D-alanine carboxypeptidase family protein [Gammaproteobacteria bacterium]|nr:D-alanyl-D-alanine carboxypeptidase family protein [Gammaproteobacteria bacterium]
MNKLLQCVAILFLTSAFLIGQSAPAATAVPAPPRINAAAYLVSDFNSGELLVAENVDVKMEPASLTKIMTVYVVAAEIASGNIKLDDQVLVSETAWRMEGSRMFIEVGKRISVHDLLLGAVIQSGNDASVALAEHVAGSEEVFAGLMNQHAERLGMKNSHFTNSTGLPHEEHYTTARDMARLAAALIRDFPDIYAMHSIKEFSFNNIRQINRNRMLWWDETVDGIKTGHTENAGYCLVTSAVRDGMRLISVVAGAESDNSRAKGTQSILNYGFRFFETRRIYPAGAEVSTVKIWKGASEQLRLGVAEDLYLTVPRGRYDELDAIITPEETITAPIEAGAVKGAIRISLEGKLLAEHPLRALESVPEGTLFKRLQDEFWLLLE